MGDYLKWKQLDKINDEKPFSPNQIRDELKVSTDNWAKEKGVFKYGYEEEAILAQKYLSKHGYNVEYNSEDNNLFPDNIVYNVWFSKEEIPDGFESGEWLNEAKKKKKKYSLSPIFPNPEDSVKFFNHVMGADKNKCKDCNNENTEATAEAEATASEGAAVGEALDENKVYGLFIKVIDSNNKTIKDWNRIDAGSKKEMDEKRKHLEEVSPEDPYHNFNKYKVSEIKESLDESIKLVSKLTVKIDNSEDYEDFISELDEKGIGYEAYPDTNKNGDPSIILELYGGDNAKEFLDDVNKIIKDLGIKVEKLEEGTSSIYLDLLDEYHVALNKAEKLGNVTFTVDPDGEYIEFDNWQEAVDYAKSKGFDRIYVSSFGFEGPDGYDNGDYEEYDEQILDLNKEPISESLNEELSDKNIETNIAKAIVFYGWNDDYLRDSIKNNKCYDLYKESEFDVRNLIDEYEDSYKGNKNKLWNKVNDIAAQLVDSEEYQEYLNNNLKEELEAGDSAYNSERDEYYFLKKTNKPNTFELYTYNGGKFVPASPRFIDKNSPFYNKLKLVDKNANPEFKEALNEDLIVIEPEEAKEKLGTLKHLIENEDTPDTKRALITLMNIYLFQTYKPSDRKDSSLTDEEWQEYSDWLKEIKDENLKEELVFSDVVKSAYNHFKSDLGMTPTVDDIIDDITNNYDGYSDIQNTPESSTKWYSAISQELNRQGLEVLTEDIKEEKSNPKIFYKCAINDEYFVSIYPEKIKEKNPKTKNIWILEWKDNGDFEDCENGKQYYSNNVVGDEESLQEYLKIKGQEKITVLENLEEAHRDDPEVVKLTNEIKDDIEKLDDLGIDTKNIDEDIEKHDTLNPVLFDENEELKPEIKEAIQKIVNEFVEGLNEDGIRFTLKDVVLVGSNVSYNYTKDSDLDVHLIADSSGLECPGELYPLLYSAYRSIFNKNYDITIKGIPTEIYVEMDENKGISNGVYSLNNGWIKHPEQTVIPDLDQEAFDNLFDEWEDKYFELLDSVAEVHNTELEEEVDDDYEKHFDKPEEDDIEACKKYLIDDLKYSRKYEFADDIGANWISASLEGSDCPVRNDKQGYLTMLMAALQLAKEHPEEVSIWKTKFGYYGDKDFLVVYTSEEDKEKAAKEVIEAWNEDADEPIEFDGILLNPDDYLKD